MFLNESDGLYTDEEIGDYPAASIELFGENFAFSCGCGNVLETLRAVDEEFLWDKTPKIVVKRATFLTTPKVVWK